MCQGWWQESSLSPCLLLLQLCWESTSAKADLREDDTLPSKFVKWDSEIKDNGGKKLWVFVKTKNKNLIHPVFERVTFWVLGHCLFCAVHARVIHFLQDYIKPFKAEVNQQPGHR